MITVFPAMGQTSSRGSENYQQSKKNNRCDRMLEVLKSETSSDNNALLEGTKTTISSGQTGTNSGPTSIAGKTTVAVAPMICRPHKRSPGPDLFSRTSQLQPVVSSSGSFMDVPLATMFTPSDIYQRVLPSQSSLQYPYANIQYSSSEQESPTLHAPGIIRPLGLPITPDRNSSITSSLQFSCDRSFEKTSASSVGVSNSASVDFREKSSKSEPTGQQQQQSINQHNEEKNTHASTTPEIKEEPESSVTRKREQPSSSASSSSPLEVSQMDDSKLPQKKRRLHPSVLAQLGSKDDTTSQGSLDFLGVSLDSSNLDENKSSVSFKDFEDLMQSVEYLKTVQQEYDQKRKELIECEQKLIVQNALVAHKKLNLDHKLRSLSQYQTEESRHSTPSSKDLFPHASE